MRRAALSVAVLLVIILTEETPCLAKKPSSRMKCGLFMEKLATRVAALLSITIVNGDRIEMEAMDAKLGCFGKSAISTPFPCQPFSRGSQKASNVHALTPADIEVIGALGDSLTTGAAMKSCDIWQAITDNHPGRSFPIGGEGTVYDNPTLANMLRMFSPNLVGFSGDDDRRFNIGEYGATSLHLKEQAKNLVEKMRYELGENSFTNKWKLVTIFIGHNDICRSCLKKCRGLFTAKLFQQRLQSTLDYLHSSLPRTLVNLVNVINMAMIGEMREMKICEIVQDAECDCAANRGSLNRAYQQAAHRLVNSGRYDSDPQFTVVLQPVLENTNIKLQNGKIDYSYLAADCFHLSEKGHAAAARSLWNSLFQPVGKKKTFLDIGEPIYCPNTTHSYIRTARN